MFNIGDTVTTITHPYYQNSTNVLISGEPSLAPPLMIIIEVFRKRKSIEIKWEDGDTEISYKCIWYSSRLNKFQSDWISSKAIKIIAEDSPQEKLCVGNMVTLKTHYLELGKKKSTYSSNDSEEIKGHTSVTSFLNFLPPLMQIENIKEVVAKKHEPLGSDHSLKHRILPSFEVNCTWYNNSADKFSQVTLPLEAVLQIGEISAGLITNINNAIMSGLYYKIGNNLAKPISINSRSGLYFVNVYDLVQNATIEIPINNQTHLSSVTPFRNHAPKFETDSSIAYGEVQSDMLELIKNSLENKSYLRLQYKNRNERVTIRTLRDYKTQEFTENAKKVFLLTGYCILRKDQRTFRLERIQNLQELDIAFQ
ncbi:MAG: WYL domain-containing protein [Bacteroidetes bacterium]|nr:WYL domain-containing protein [Bacteroidota bacterium]